MVLVLVLHKMSWSWSCYIGLGNLSRLFIISWTWNLEVLIINTRNMGTAVPAHAVIKLQKDCYC